MQSSQQRPSLCGGGHTEPLLLPVTLQSTVDIGRLQTLSQRGQRLKSPPRTSLLERHPAQLS